MKKHIILTLLLSSLFTANAFAGTDSDQIDISGLTDQQSDMVQAELTVFSTIAYTKITPKNEPIIKKELQAVIYCGYDAFANNQTKFNKITKSNEQMIFETTDLMSKYRHFAQVENNLPSDLAVCAKYHKSA